MAECSGFLNSHIWFYLSITQFNAVSSASLDGKLIKLRRIREMREADFTGDWGVPNKQSEMPVAAKR